MKNLIILLAAIVGYSLWKKRGYSTPSETTLKSNITPEEADIRANEIHDAWGLINDDEGLIFEHLKDVNIQAYKLIEQSYGKRKPVLTASGMRLTETLNYMLTKTEIKELKSLNPVLSFLSK